jgi:transcriptional regulator of heat shock response
MDTKTYNGKIYSIRSHQTDLIYIGSTCETRLSARMCKHRSNYKIYTQKKHHYTAACEILKYDDAYIELVEEVKDKTKDELHRIEGEHIRTNNKCVNRNIAGQTLKEYRDKNKDKAKEYVQTNKDKLQEYKKVYYDINKDKWKYNKEQYEAKKHIKNAKYVCECGKTLSKCSKVRHDKICKAIK